MNYNVILSLYHNSRNRNLIIDQTLLQIIIKKSKINFFLSNHALNLVLNFNFSKSDDIRMKFIILEIVFSILFFQLCIAGTGGMQYIRFCMKLRLQRC